MLTPGLYGCGVMQLSAVYQSRCSSNRTRTCSMPGQGDAGEVGQSLPGCQRVDGPLGLLLVSV